MKKIYVLLLLLICSVSFVNAQVVRYKGVIEGHYSFSEDEYASDQIILTTSHGVSLLSNRLFAGAGIGIGISAATVIFQTYNIPIFADVRYNLRNGRVRPFIATKVGSGLILEEDHDGGIYTDGGLYVAPSVGVALALSRKTEFFVSAGYTYHEATAESEYWDFDFIGHNIDKFNAGGFTLSLGFSF